PLVYLEDGRPVSEDDCGCAMFYARLIGIYPTHSEEIKDRLRPALEHFGLTQTEFDYLFSWKRIVEGASKELGMPEPARFGPKEATQRIRTLIARQ
ncbi:MAG: hypothetical protein MN733_33265, partial [Nitrososphaera sp.]|nr:hypothetical protein [Nitrososphaera sp.]